MSKSKDQHNIEIVDLIGEIYQSIITPERFMEILDSWNHSIVENKEVEQNTLDLIEVQLKNAVPMIESSFKNLVSQDDLIQQLNEETNPSILISSKNLIVGINESGRSHFNIEIGDEFNRSSLNGEDGDKFSAILNSSPDTNEESEHYVLSITLRDGRGLPKNSLVAVKCVRPSYSNTRYIVMSAIGVQLVGKSRELFKSTFSLTETELELVDLLIQGMGPKAISEIRNCREDTVKKQFKAIREKTMCNNSTALVCLVASFTNILKRQEIDKQVDEERSFTNSANQTYMMPSRNKLAKFDSFQLEYCEYGPKHLRPILMQNFTITGFALPPEFIKTLNNRGYRLIVVYRPGYGMSTPIEGKKVYKDIADRMIQFIKFLKLDRYAMISGTIGLLHSLALAKKQEGKVLGLTSISSFLPLGEKRLNLMLPAHQSVVHKHLKSNKIIAKFLLLGGYRLLLQHGPHAFLSKILKDSQADLSVISDASSFDIISVGLKAALAQGIDALILDATLVGENWQEIVSETQIPMKLIHGDHDTMFKIPFVEEFCNGNGIELEIMKNTGHLTMYAKPKMTAEKIANFFDKLDGWD